MSDEMGTLRVDVEVENPVRPGEKRLLRSVLVDTGAELSWFPADLLEALGISRILRIDPVSKRLIDAGPAPAAVAA